jgi:hypothetical protein
MKKALLTIILATLLSLFIYSCSSGDDDNSSKLSSEISAPTSSSNQNDNQEEFNLSISANEGGVVSSSGGKYINGSSISVSATPNNGFEFAGWSNGSKQNPLSITLTSNQSIAANFNKKTYKLEINLDGEGIVEKELISGEGSLDSPTFGSVVKLTAVPNENRSFMYWDNIPSDSIPIKEITIDQNKSLTALFDFQNAKKMIGSWEFGFNNSASKNNNLMTIVVDISLNALITTTINGEKSESFSKIKFISEDAFIFGESVLFSSVYIGSNNDLTLNFNSLPKNINISNTVEVLSKASSVLNLSGKKLNTTPQEISVIDGLIISKDSYALDDGSTSSNTLSLNLENQFKLIAGEMGIFNCPYFVLPQKNQSQSENLDTDVDYNFLVCPGSNSSMELPIEIGNYPAFPTKGQAQVRFELISKIPDGLNILIRRDPRGSASPISILEISGVPTFCKSVCHPFGMVFENCNDGGKFDFFDLIFQTKMDPNNPCVDPQKLVIRIKEDDSCEKTSEYLNAKECKKTNDTSFSHDGWGGHSAPGVCLEDCDTAPVPNNTSNNSENNSSGQETNSGNTTSSGGSTSDSTDQNNSNQGSNNNSNNDSNSGNDNSSGNNNSNNSSVDCNINRCAVDFQTDRGDGTPGLMIWVPGQTMNGTRGFSLSYSCHNASTLDGETVTGDFNDHLINSTFTLIDPLPSGLSLSYSNGVGVFSGVVDSSVPFGNYKIRYKFNNSCGNWAWADYERDFTIQINNYDCNTLLNISCDQSSFTSNLPQIIYPGLTNLNAQVSVNCNFPSEWFENSTIRIAGSPQYPSQNSSLPTGISLTYSDGTINLTGIISKQMTDIGRVSTEGGTSDGNIAVYISPNPGVSCGERYFSIPYTFYNSPSVNYQYNYTVTAQNSNDYILNGFSRVGGGTENDPDIIVNVGDALDFSVNSPGHPFYLKTAQTTGSDNLLTGVNNNGTENGLVQWTADRIGTFYYQCSLHQNMSGKIIVR